MAACENANGCSCQIQMFISNIGMTITKANKTQSNS